MLVLSQEINDSILCAIWFLIAAIIVLFAWISTNVRDLIFPVFPRNLLLIIERRPRGYRRNSNNNVNRVNMDTAREVAQLTLSAESLSNVSNGIELVGEVVEQALVDELLDDTLLSGSHPDDDAVLISNAQNELNNLTQNNSNIETSTVAGAAATSSSSSTIISSEIITTNDESHSSDYVTTASSCDDNNQNNDDQSTILNIFIRFVNENVKKIQVKPTDTIFIVKKTHFSSELSNNKVVRFIYQGQFLKDNNTIKSYNIRDQTTIHCHITVKNCRNNNNNNSNTNASTITSNNNNNVSISSSSNSNNNQQIASNAQEAIITTSTVTTTTTTTSVVSTTNSIRRPNEDQLLNDNVNLTDEVTTTNNANNFNSTLTSIEYGSVLLPIFTVLLASIWYFRINFKQFFSPLSNLILFFITFIYIIFLLIHFYQMFRFAQRLTISVRAAHAAGQQQN